MNKNYLVKTLIVSICFSCAVFTQERLFTQVKYERKRFQKSSYVIKQPKEKSFRDDENGNEIDTNARVVEVDKNAGKYEFRWIGFDGKEKIVAYQRHDAIDAVVSAEVQRSKVGSYFYTYDLQVLPESPTYFTAFTVQTFATDTKPWKLDKKKFYFASMKYNPMYKEGVWWDWAFLGDEQDRIRGGDSVRFQLVTKSPPGIVNCKVTAGALGTMGVGEEMPGLLANQIPISADLATGYTIAPDERLLKFSKSDKIKYLLENLPKFKEAGWMSDGTAKNYEQILKNGDLIVVYEKARKDFKDQFISSEVFRIIEGLTESH